jgi:hypothetical protein
VPLGRERISSKGKQRGATKYERFSSSPEPDIKAYLALSLAIESVNV